MKYKKLVLLLSLATSFLFGCNEPNYELSFNQELSLSEGTSFDLKNITKTNIDLSLLTYSVTDTSIASINGSVVCGLKGGTTEINVSGKSKSAKQSLKVLSKTPTIEYSSGSFDVRLDKSNVLDMAKEVSFTNCSEDNARIRCINVSHGFSISGLEITFTDKGSYSFEMKATNNDKDSSPYYFVVNVFESLKLDGKGSLEDPFLISSGEDLKLLSREILDGYDSRNVYFKQTCDISLSKYSNWTPIGAFGLPFEGIYDGCNYKVTDMKIDVYVSYQGLFGFSTGIIKNVAVYGDVNVTCAPDMVYSHSMCAGVVGAINNRAIVYNCENYATVHGDSYVGGICGYIARSDERMVGRDQATVVNCRNYGKIEADDTFAINENAMYFGGICGASDGIITGCSNYGDVVTTGDKIKYTGGIAGMGYICFKYGMYFDESMDNYANNDNKNYGHIIGVNCVGGIFGCNALPSYRCENEGLIEGDLCVGGIAGMHGTKTLYESNLSIAGLFDCVNKGEIKTNINYGGGITGCNYFDIGNCTNQGKINGSQEAHYLGGIAGYQSIGDIFDCVNEESGVVKGYRNMGGIVGHAVAGYRKISNCINKASVECYEEAEKTAISIGGIVGMLGSTNTAEHCINYGNVHGKGHRISDLEPYGGIGGVAGSIYDNSCVAYCENYGNIYGTVMVGGIVGFCKTNALLTRISSCINGESASVNATALEAHAGGIVGRMNYGNLTDNSNYAPVNVQSGATNFGFIYGSYVGSVISNNVNYYEQ